MNGATRNKYIGFASSVSGTHGVHVCVHSMYILCMFLVHIGL